MQPCWQTLSHIIMFTSSQWVSGVEANDAYNTGAFRITQTTACMLIGLLS